MPAAPAHSGSDVPKFDPRSPSPEAEKSASAVRGRVGVRMAREGPLARPGEAGEGEVARVVVAGPRVDVDADARAREREGAAGVGGHA